MIPNEKHNEIDEETLSIRKRPAMYVGYKNENGIYEIMKHLVSESCPTESIFYTITLSKSWLFTIRFQSKKNLSSFLKSIIYGQINENYFMGKVVRALSTHFAIAINQQFGFQLGQNPAQTWKNIKQESIHDITLEFELDKQYFESQDISFLRFCDVMKQIAMLHRNAEFLITDIRGQFLNQQYLHFPDGIFCIAEQIKAEKYSTVLLENTFEGTMGNYTYQIAVGYRNSWSEDAYIRSYANDDESVLGGSLIEGVLAGLTDAFQTYIETNSTQSMVITSDKIKKHLFLIGAVRGNLITWEGSFRFKIHEPQIFEDTKKIAFELGQQWIYKSTDQVDKLINWWKPE